MSDKPKVYPRWKYHKTQPAQIVKNEAHEDRLGDDWKESPADHGVITAPSVHQQNVAQLGYDPESTPEDEPKEEEEPAEEESERPNVPRRRGR